jgi:DNA polymerase-3 subunit alpha (Gram-positive type)
MPAVALQAEAANAWLARLCADADAAVRDAFDGASVDELLYWPEEGRLRMTLSLSRAAEEATPFDHLREHLAGQGVPSLELRVRYRSGALGLGEYLGLHFDDLCLALRHELSLDPRWMGGLDYRLDEDEGSLAVLVGNPLALRSLHERKASLRLAELLQWGCGIRPSVALEQGEFSPEPQPTAEPPTKLDPAPAPAPVPTAATPAPALKPASDQKAATSNPPAEKVLWGRSIPSAAVKRMADLLTPQDNVAVEGRIFYSKSEVRGKQGKTLVKLSISDGSDSLSVNAWLDAGKQAPKELEPGNFCRVRGRLELNKWEGDQLVLMADHAMSVPKTLRRKDEAPVKRVELHAHTKMSAADGLTNIDEYIQRAIDWGHAAVGISDHGVVHSFPEAWKLSKKKVKLLLGMEAYFVEDASFIPKLREAREQKRPDLAPPVPEYWHCMIYARTDKGRRHLYDLVSHSHTKTFYRKPLIDRALLASKREDLLIGSACEQGELYQAVNRAASDEELERIASFYDYLEVQPPQNNAFMVRNGSATEEQLQDNVRRIVALAQKLDKPVVATSDLHFLDPEDEVFRRILQAGQGFSDADLQAPLYFHTTQEMLDDMAFLGPELAYKVTVEDTNKVAGMCDAVPPVPSGAFFPEMEGADESIRTKAQARAEELYGAPLPEMVRARLDRELNAVIGNKFGVLYEIARLLVKESNDKGYSVGSRGSVGSSFAAYCLKITEVNPLPAHERCPQCRWIEFRELERLAGVDLPARACPQCGTALIRDGYNIPFETFVGFKGNKVPDIDLNFAPEVQTQVQKYAEELFGKGQAYKAGTISTLADKQAFGYVMKYFDAKGGHPRKVEIERLKSGLEGVKRTSGQHPGGVVLVRKDMDINDVTPVQFSGDLNEMGGAEKAGGETLMTTHFDYHAYDETLVKLDILGKDDGSAFKHLQELTGVAESTVPLDDAKALSLFSSGAALSMGKLTAEEKDWLGETGAVALPEFGTGNTRRMLELTKPKNFTELIYISGLSHGTGVWANNAEKLIVDKTASLETVISTRDDIMNTLIQHGMDKALAYDITEAIRKGKVARDGFKPEEEAALKAAKLKPWWIESCRKIQYMFPKAHATAYCFTAVRLAWFKVHHPAAFYSAWLTLHAESVESDVVAGGKSAILGRLRQLKERREARGDEGQPKWTAKDEGTLGALVVALEAVLRGIQFAKVDLYKSHPSRFTPQDAQTLRLPLVSLAGLGETAAERIHAERLQAEHGGAPFRSIEDLARRCGLNKTVIEKLEQSGALAILPRSDQADLFGAL